MNERTKDHMKAIYDWYYQIICTDLGQAAAL